MAIELLSPYRRLANDKRYTLVEGGRGSAKSFHVAVYLLQLTYEENEVILFTRYTMTSAQISIIPEFREKIEMFGLEEAFEITNNQITNRYTGSRIIFSGIKTSSGNQTAKLKSIAGLSCWVLDEAEEMPSKAEFDKIDDSIRKKGASNRVILVLNPAYKTHWIYKHFHQEGKRADTEYIHTTFEDNRANLSNAFLNKINQTRQNAPEEFKWRYLGEWQDVRKGIIYPHYEVVDSAPDGLRIYGLDFGYNDPMALVEVTIADPFVYVQELLYERFITVDDLIKRLPALGVSENANIYCDSANPGDIQQIFNAGYRRAKPALKGSGSIASGIGKVKSYSLRIVRPSTNLLEELLNYAWDEDKDGNLVDGKPIDAYNHAADAMRYAIYTHTFRPSTTGSPVARGYRRRERFVR